MLQLSAMEASMRGPCDESGGTTESGFFQRWGAGFLVLPVLVVITLIGLAIVQPATTNWIADEVMAEFTGANYAPGDTATQLAKAVR
jgi:hypothetical protein